MQAAGPLSSVIGCLWDSVTVTVYWGVLGWVPIQQNSEAHATSDRGADLDLSVYTPKNRKRSTCRSWIEYYGTQKINPFSLKPASKSQAPSKMHRKCKRVKRNLHQKTASIRVCATVMGVYGRAAFGLETAFKQQLVCFKITFMSVACHSDLTNETNPDVSAL